MNGTKSTLDSGCRAGMTNVLTQIWVCAKLVSEIERQYWK
jgi:hypothetical protein